VVRSIGTCDTRRLTPPSHECQNPNDRGSTGHVSLGPTTMIISAFHVSRLRLARNLFAPPPDRRNHEISPHYRSMALGLQRSDDSDLLRVPLVKSPYTVDPCTPGCQNVESLRRLINNSQCPPDLLSDLFLVTNLLATPLDPMTYGVSRSSSKLSTARSDLQDLPSWIYVVLKPTHLPQIG